MKGNNNTHSYRVCLRSSLGVQILIAEALTKGGGPGTLSPINKERKDLLETKCACLCNIQVVRHEDKTDHRSYIHNLSSCEIKA